MRIRLSGTSLLGTILFFAVGTVSAQDPPLHHPAAETAHKEETAEGPSDFEVEYVASDIFRSGSYLQPIWRGLGFEGHYFGGTTTDTGFVCSSWTFRIKELKLSPGFGVSFGSNQYATSPTVSLRVGYEKRWFVAQGLVLQGFRKTPVFGEEEEGHHAGPRETVSYVRPKISDGNHVSVRWRRLEVGGTFEHIQFREGSEWKSGGRLRFRLLPRLSAILYVLAPGRTEWRGGVLIHPPCCK